MREHLGGLCRAAAIVIQTGTAVIQMGSAPFALAAEPLSRKAGLWEVKTTIDTSNAPPTVVKQCIDAATDQLSQSVAGPFSAAACPEWNVQRSADSVTVDSTCTVAGKPATAHAVMTGSFDSAYAMKVTAQGEALPGGKMIMMIEGQWIGPCTADQKPGDIIMSNGMKINIPEMQKLKPSTVDPMAPH